MKRHLNSPEPTGPVLLGFKVVAKPFSNVRAIFAELGQSSTKLMLALKIGHGIEFDPIEEDPTLYFVVSQEQSDGFAKAGYEPTLLQLLGTSEVISLSEEAAIAKFRAIKGAEPERPDIILPDA